MILEFVFKLILDLIIILLEPLGLGGFVIPDWFSNFIILFCKALFFFPFDVWSVVLSNIVFWVLVHFVWSIIEWIYIKIPGVS